MKKNYFLALCLAILLSVSSAFSMPPDQNYKNFSMRVKALALQLLDNPSFEEERREALATMTKPFVDAYMALAGDGSPILSSTVDPRFDFVHGTQMPKVPDVIQYNVDEAAVELLSNYRRVFADIATCEGQFKTEFENPTEAPSPEYLNRIAALFVTKKDLHDTIIRSTILGKPVDVKQMIIDLVEELQPQKSEADTLSNYRRMFANTAEASDLSVQVPAVPGVDVILAPCVSQAPSEAQPAETGGQEPAPAVVSHPLDGSSPDALFAPVTGNGSGDETSTAPTPAPTPAAVQAEKKKKGCSVL